MKYAYPAIFAPDEDAISVTFPDVKGCITCGDDMAEARLMAQDALEMMLAHYEDKGLPVPASSDIEKIDTPYAVSFVQADTDEWRRKVGSPETQEKVLVGAGSNNGEEKYGL